MNDTKHDPNAANKEHDPFPSVTELCADHENLREYIAQLERERDVLREELEARDKKDRAERVESGTFRHQLIDVSSLLDAEGIRTHWDYTSGISVAARVKMLIERSRNQSAP